MNDILRRRDFLRTVGLAAGGVWLTGASSARAFNPYDQVEKALFKGINRAADPAKLTALEKKHLPMIEAPAKVKAGEPFAVTVTVGETVHPMGTGHYIHYVELLAGNEPAGRINLAPEFNHPKGTFYLTLDRSVTLVVREYCNLHGLWESEKDVVVG